MSIKPKATEKPEYLALKLGGKYRVISIPIPRPEKYPPSGSIGEVCWTSSLNGAGLEIKGTKFVVPFNCLEEVSDTIEDAELVAVMLDNPYGIYKLLRGMWRMTKNTTIRNFMERGELPEDGTALVKRNNKSPSDYSKQWEEAEEAALTGAFQSEFIS